MKYFRFAKIWLGKSHVVVYFCLNVFYIRHVIVYAFDHVMTGGTDCDQILSFFFGVC